MKQELIPKPETPLATQPPDVERFIMAAIDKGVPIETMERLLALRAQLRAEQAKEAFDTALAAFQAACPVIHKDKKVDFTSKRTGGRTTYSYAPMDSIISQVKDKLKDHGFSYSVTAEIIDQGGANWVAATCIAKHIGGHSESSSFRVPIDKEAFMNAQQQVASALTYAKRYAFCNAFGIMTGDDDTDANTEPEKKDHPAASSTPSNPTEQKRDSKPEEKKSGDKLTATGFVIDLIKNPTPAKNGAHRYKIVLDNKEGFYTFDTKFVELIDKADVTKHRAEITYHVGKFGKDIDDLVFLTTEQDFKNFTEGEQNK